MNFEDSLQYLLSLGHETTALKLGLHNTEFLLAKLDHPHTRFPKVQIAGTNGKGSTAHMLDSICRAAGISTGLYTSPHLISITERIRLNGNQISPQEFARHATTVRDAARRVATGADCHPTFFEQVTLIALEAFREARVDLAILETGLGGRLDATTAALSETVAITPVALDHEEYLGHTLSEVAGEKAAIIRPGTAVVVAPQPPEALRVIEERCRVCNITPRFSEAKVRVLEACDPTGRLSVRFESSQDCYTDACLALRGRHQAVNAGVCIELAELLREQGFSISRDAIVHGLETAQHAGRLELLPGTPRLLLDGAHNPAGAQALRDFIDEFVHPPITLIFGAMRDKDAGEMMATLFPVTDHVVLTEFANPRAASHEMLRRAVPPEFDDSRIMLAAGGHEALQIARHRMPVNGLVCVAGSLYLVGEIKSILDSPLP